MGSRPTPRTRLECLLRTVCGGSQVDMEEDVRLLSSDHPKIERTDAAQLDKTQTYDPFEDDTPLACGIDNPDYCESCQ